MSKVFNYLLCFFLSLLLSACQLSDGSSSDDDIQLSSGVDENLRQLINDNGLTGDPSTGRNIPNIEDPLPQLGKKLFFTKAMGGQFDSACVTCHHPMLGGGDAMSLSVGTYAELPDLLGPGRLHLSDAPGYDGGPTVPRNSPSTFNVALWDTAMFWDGKVESIGKTPGANGNDGFGISTPDSSFDSVDVRAGFDLPEAQARFPVTSPVEMRGFDFEMDGDNHSLRKHLAQRIGGYGEAALELAVNHWLQEFQAVFDSTQSAEELITVDHIFQAISAYERSQLFINSPWKAYVEGDDTALSEPAKRGAVLFFTPVEEDGAGCNACHSGDFFSDGLYHALATVQIGRGTGNGEFGDNDFGRFNVTNNIDDLFAFRTPTLLNAEVTGPWGHAGSYTTLDAIVRHYVNPREALTAFDYSSINPNIQITNAIQNTNEALEHLDKLRVRGDTLFLVDVPLDDVQINDVLEFVKALTDPCVKSAECLAPWVPDANDADPDDNRVNALILLRP